MQSRRCPPPQTDGNVLRMSEPTKPFRVASVIWSIVLTIGILALVGSILLPSTKRARFDFTQQERERMATESAAATATTEPTTAPAN